MVKKIIMFYGKGCLNAIVMMPVLTGMNRNGKYKFEFVEIWHDKEGQKIKEKYQEIINLTIKKGKENSVPVFVDEENKKAIYSPDVETLLAWLEGPDWWKS